MGGIWTREPPLGIWVNQAHPLGRGIKVAYLLNDDSADAGGQRLVLTNRVAGFKTPKSMQTWTGFGSNPFFRGRPHEISSLHAYGNNRYSNRYESCLHFDEATYVNIIDGQEIPWALNFAGCNQMSIVFRIRMNTGTDRRYSIFTENTGSPYDSQYGVFFRQQTNQVRFAIKAGGSVQYYSPTGATIPHDEWIQCACIYDGAYMRIYLDLTQYGTGQAKTGTIDTRTPQAGRGVQIGVESALATGDYDLDYLYMYERALTTNELRYLLTNPYCMFMEPGPMAIFVAAGGLVQFASSASITSSTQAAALAIQRQLSSTGAVQASTAAVILAVLRQLNSSATIQTSTAGIAASIQRAMASSSSVQSATSAAILAIRRELASAAAVASVTADADVLVQRAMATLAAVQTLTSDINLDLGTGVKQFASAAAVQTATASILMAIERPFASASAIQSVGQDALLTLQRTLASVADVQTTTADVDISTAMQFTSIAAIVTSTGDAGLAVRRTIATLAAAQTDTGSAILAILRRLASQADVVTTTAAIDLLLGVIGEIINPSSVSVTPVRSSTGINIKTSTSKTPVRTTEPA